MPNHKNLAKQIKALHSAISNLDDQDQTAELLKIILRPGWTTPAELLFASSIIESMLANLAALTRLNADLLKASRAVSGR